ncbi:MAG: GNAT family N-acetyltransferase [Chitinophagales bacterium]
MTIRYALSKDFKDFYDINLQADTYHRLAVPSKFRKPPKDFDYELFMFNKFSNLLSDKNCIFLVAVEDKVDTVLGYLIALKKSTSDYPILIPRQYILVDNMCVHENVRQQGIGSLLLQKIEEEAIVAGYSSIELNVYNFNKGAKKLYIQNGFEPIVQRMQKEIR